MTPQYIAKKSCKNKKIINGTIFFPNLVVNS
jgi:hypothetical protein